MTTGFSLCTSDRLSDISCFHHGNHSCYVPFSTKFTTSLHRSIQCKSFMCGYVSNEIAGHCCTTMFLISTLGARCSKSPSDAADVIYTAHIPSDCWGSLHMMQLETTCHDPTTKWIGVSSDVRLYLCLCIIQGAPFFLDQWINMLANAHISQCAHSARVLCVHVWRSVCLSVCVCVCVCALWCCKHMLIQLWLAGQVTLGA